MGKENKHWGAFFKFPPQSHHQKCHFSAGSASCVHTSPSPPLAWCRARAGSLPRRAGVQSRSVSARDEENLGGCWKRQTGQWGRPHYFPWFWQHSWKEWGLAQVPAPLRVARAVHPAGILALPYLLSVQPWQTKAGTYTFAQQLLNKYGQKNLHTTGLQQSPPTPCTVVC